MRALAVHHVSINVDDLDAAIAFYTAALGLSPRRDRPDLQDEGAWLDAGDQQVHLIVGDVPSQEGQHFAVLVGDIDAAIGELRGAGVEVSDAVPIGSGRQAFLRDPAGNLIELHQRS